jgi:putative oxidoreductase
MTGVRTLARGMLAAIFVTGGFEAILDPDRLAPRAKQVTDRVAPLLAKVHPYAPSDSRALVQSNGAVQVVAGLLLLSPARRAAAVALAGSLIPTTIAGHSFWLHDNPAERAQQRVNFLKNVGLFGGLMLAAMDTEGKPGVRWRAGHLAHHAGRSMRRAAHQTQSKAKIARRAAAIGRRMPV